MAIKQLELAFLLSQYLLSEQTNFQNKNHTENRSFLHEADPKRKALARKFTEIRCIVEM